MDTNELIDALTRDLQPVRRLQAPCMRAAALCGFALAAVAAVIHVLGGPRPDWRDVLHSPALMAGDLLMPVAGFLAAVAAFILAVPDTKIRRPVVLLLGLATLAWAGICLKAAAAVTLQDIHAEFHEIAESAACVKALVFMSAIPLAASFFMALRAAPVWRGWAGYALTLSMASFGAFGMRFFCPSDAPSHLMLWHFLPVVILSVFGGLLGRVILRFRL